LLITNEVRVNATPEALYDVITDVERVVTCIPGAELLSSDGNEHRARVTFKVGPITAAFEGTIQFTETVPDQRIVKLVASGEDTKGNGTAEANVTVSVTPEGENSILNVETDVLVKGKFAQFGKGAISAVANRILGQFAKNITKLLENEAPRDEKNNTTTSAPASSTPNGASPNSPAEALSATASATPTWAWVAVFLSGCVQGWIVTRAFGQRTL
jgi:hypothetical protein